MYIIGSRDVVGVVCDRVGGCGYWSSLWEIVLVGGLGEFLFLYGWCFF